MADRTRGPADSTSQHRAAVQTMSANGMSQRQIAAALGISPQTVQSHVRHAMVKLAAASRTEAVATALRRSLIP